MGNGFGEKLRAERLERGLTQAELGKDLYSPSYISLLETGRREPTADVIEELARRLELAPKALEAWSQPISVSDAEYVLAGLYARQAWDLRDYPSPPNHAATAARIALEGKNTSAWWNMTYMQAECLMKQGQLAGVPEGHGAPAGAPHGHRIGRAGGPGPPDARCAVPRAGPAERRRRACPGRP